jgi:hypothetical protein
MDICKVFVCLEQRTWQHRLWRCLPSQMWEAALNGPLHKLTCPPRTCGQSTGHCRLAMGSCLLRYPWANESKPQEEVPCYKAVVH